MEPATDNMEGFYQTTNVKTYFWRPGNNFAKLEPPHKEVDPNLIPGHVFNTITVRGKPIKNKTWDFPAIANTPEEYRAFLHRLKQSHPALFKKYFTNPDVNVDLLFERLKDDQLTTYESAYSPDDYVARNEWVKWTRSKLDVSRFAYQPTTYDCIYSRVKEIDEFREISKPFVWSYDDELIKKKLRHIYKSETSSYNRQFCELPIPKMEENLKKGRTYKGPNDAYTNRKV